MRFIEYFICIVFCLILSDIKAEYLKAEYNDCGSQDVVIHSIDIYPMPIRYPGTFNITLKHTLKRPIKNVQLSIAITRSVSNIHLPVRCYLVDGLYVGSCNYTGDEICQLIKNWWPKTFGLYLTSLVSTILGNNCSESPHQIVINKAATYNEILQLPNLSGSVLSFFMSGDFNVKITAMEQNTNVFCGIFKYTIKSKP